MDLPHCKKPCKHCPFRKDCRKGWLREERIKQILSADSFVCHKNKKLQCAGHMLIRGEKNSFVWLARLLDISLDLKGRELIFDSDSDCVIHHS